MPSSSIAELQQKLYKQIGINAPVTKARNVSNRGGKRPSTRRNLRKVQRIEKKTNIYGGHTGTATSSQTQRKPRTTQPGGNYSAQSRQTISKQTANSQDTSSDGEDFDESMSDCTDGLVDLQEEDSANESDDSSDAASANSKSSKKISKAMQEKLNNDDREVKAFERKLGIKGRKSLPQSFKEDGLGDLLGDFDDDDGGETEEEEEEQKRKQDFDDWLSSKRRKTAGGLHKELRRHKRSEKNDSVNVSSDENDFVDDDENDSFEGFDTENETEQEGEEERNEKHQSAPKRENPYVAPTNGNIVARYVPPSQRGAATTESEQRTRLQRSVQGLVNRMTDANIISIVQSVEELYQKNSRGETTEVITDVILAQIYKPELLPDQFFVLTGGFTAAIYKIVGTSFGSHVIRRLVQNLAKNYDQADDGDASTRRNASNLVNFLTQLYVFGVVNCRILFDYMERFLSKLSELNVELLLRICRMAGRMLRRDDAQSLKHIASVLNAKMSNSSLENVPVRTKFMIETINDLKNSKPKGKGLDSAIVSEHVVRMKKRIGELKSQSRRLDGLAPMGMSLQDIEGADTDGKWWLVGASVPAKKNTNTAKEAGEAADDSDNATSDEEDMDFVLPDYPQKARSQGFSTMAQIAIFTALMTANDSEHGYSQFVNLKLKKDDQLEIARVLVQCVGSETEYNKFYALVANQACSNNKLRFAFQDRLWRIFRDMGESMFGDDADNEETADSERMKDPRRLANVAQFYASLVADGSLSLAILKPLDLVKMNRWTSDFVEHLLVRLLRQCRSKDSSKEDAKVSRIFEASRTLPAMSAGLHWFLRSKKLRKSKLIGTKEAKRLESIRQKAETAVLANEVV